MTVAGTWTGILLAATLALLSGAYTCLSRWSAIVHSESAKHWHAALFLRLAKANAIVALSILLSLASFWSGHPKGIIWTAGGGLLGLFMLLPWRRDDPLREWHAPVPSAKKSYDKARINRLREVVKAVRHEWMKLPVGPDEATRSALLRELRLAGEDFLTDKAIGPLIYEIEGQASLMDTLSSAAYSRTFGGPAYEKITERNTKLQNAALALLDRTRDDVIFES